MLNLGALDGYEFSQAVGINDSGQVVGECQPNSGVFHAFLYSGGTMEDLNGLIPQSSDWTLEWAYAINDNGQIVGWGINPAGQQKAYLLTPTTEPSTLALLGAGALAVLAFAWRRRRSSARAAATIQKGR